MIIGPLQIVTFMHGLTPRLYYVTLPYGWSMNIGWIWINWSNIIVGSEERVSWD